MGAPWEAWGFRRIHRGTLKPTLPPRSRPLPRLDMRMLEKVCGNMRGNFVKQKVCACVKNVCEQFETMCENRSENVCEKLWGHSA